MSHLYILPLCYSVVYFLHAAVKLSIVSIQLFLFFSQLIDTHWYGCAFCLSVFVSSFPPLVYLPVAWVVDLAVQGCKYCYGASHPSHLSALTFINAFSPTCRSSVHVPRVSPLSIRSDMRHASTDTNAFPPHSQHAARRTSSFGPKVAISPECPLAPTTLNLPS